MEKLLEFIRTNQGFKVVIIVLAFIPLINLFFFEGTGMHPYNILWIGFYACILIFLSFGKSFKEIVVKIMAVAVNLPTFFLCAMGSLMVGWRGLLFTIGCLFLPGRYGYILYNGISLNTCATAVTQSDEDEKII